MPKYLSGRVKRTPQGSLTTDRYQYLGLDQAEPNLGDPPDIRTIPTGETQYQIISVESKPGERFWKPIGGGSIPAAHTVRSEGLIVPRTDGNATLGIDSITDVNFVGAAITVTGFLNADGSPGTAVTVTISPPGNDNEILFNDNGEFGTSSIFSFDNSTVGVASVGIGTSQPTQNLHIVGNLRLENAFFDEENQSGDQGDLLVKTASGGLKYTPAGSVTSGAGGTITEIQFHDSTGLVNGAENFVFDFTNKRVGIGSTQPDRLLDVLGESRFTGIATFAGDVSIADKIIHTGDTNTSIRFPAADTFAVETAGDERLRITSVGYVGINETSPIHQLSIGIDTSTAWDSTKNISNTTNNDFIALNLDNKNSGSNPEVGMMFQAGASGSGQYTINCRKSAGNSADLIFRTRDGGAASKETLRITSDGKVGINSTIPAVNGIDLIGPSSGNGEIKASRDGGASILTQAQDSLGRFGTSSNHNLQLMANSSGVVNITTGGKVGIGTTNITSKLTIASHNNDNPIETIRYNEGVDGATLFLQHSRSNDIGTKVQLNDNDEVGNIEFRSFASDNSTIVRAARIFAEADGTADTTDVPAALVFSTNSKTGAGTAEERLRIDSSGHLLRGGSDQNIGASNATWNKVYAQEFIGQINTIQENLEINNLNVNGISTFVGLSTFNNGIIVESGISTFNDSVGIGTIPASGTTLDIDASGGGVLALRRNSVNTSNKITLSHDGTDGTLESTNDVIIRAGGDERLVIDSGGQVGIGTVDADQTVEVFKKSGLNLVKVSTEANSTVGFEIEKTGSTTQSWRIVDGQTENGSLEFYDVTDTETRMLIDGDGNLGVGLVSPTAKFHVNGTQNGLQARFGGTGTGLGITCFQKTNNNAGVMFVAQDATHGTFTFHTAGSERLRITSGGKVEVQGTRDGNLQANEDDALKLFTKSNSNAVNRGTGITFYIHDGSDYEMGGTIQVAKENEITDPVDAKSYMRFSTQSGSTTTERLRITSTGEVNIGGDYSQTTYKMKVTGTVAATNFDSLSDQKLKINVKKIKNPIETVNKIDGVTFNWKRDDVPSMGVIAQNVEKVLPEIVSGDDTKSVNYSGLIGLLIEVVKDQQKQINELRDRLDK